MIEPVRVSSSDSEYQGQAEEYCEEHGLEDRAQAVVVVLAWEPIPRISRLMALGIHMQRLIDEGLVRDYAERASLRS